MPDLGKPIALGRTAEIYAWREGKILKLFRDWFPKTAIEYEARVAQAVYASGLPVPAPGELIQVEGRLGLEYERLDGPTMLREFQNQPWRIPSMARLFAELHAQMHATSTHQPNSQRERLQNKIKEAKPLSESLKQAALDALDKMPGGDALCHGDFHPDNIIMTAARPVVIDWIDVTSGNPLADFARTAILIRYGAPPPQNPLGLIIELGRGTFYRAYHRHYFELTHANPAEVQAWIPIIAAARLNEEIQEEESNLVSIVQKGFAPLKGGSS